MSASTANRNDMDFVLSCLRWIEDDEKRAGGTWLACAHFESNPDFEQERFKFMIKEKIHLNKIHKLRLADFGRKDSAKPCKEPT